MLCESILLLVGPMDLPFRSFLTYERNPFKDFFRTGLNGKQIRRYRRHVLIFYHVLSIPLHR
jgi:hypothetical protein